MSHLAAPTHPFYSYTEWQNLFEQHGIYSQLLSCFQISLNETRFQYSFTSRQPKPYHDPYCSLYVLYIMLNGVPISVLSIYTTFFVLISEFNEKTASSYINTFDRKFGSSLHWFTNQFANCRHFFGSFG